MTSAHNHESNAQDISKGRDADDENMGNTWERKNKDGLVLYGPNCEIYTGTKKLNLNANICLTCDAHKI